MKGYVGYVDETLKCSLRVIQGHWKWYHSKVLVWFPIFYSIAMFSCFDIIHERDRHPATQPDTARRQAAVARQQVIILLSVCVSTSKSIYERRPSVLEGRRQRSRLIAPKWRRMLSTMCEHENPPGKTRTRLLQVQNNTKFRPWLRRPNKTLSLYGMFSTIEVSW